MEYEVTIRMRITAPNDTRAGLIADELAEAVELAWMRNDDAEYREARVQCVEAQHRCPTHPPSRACDCAECRSARASNSNPHGYISRD